MTKIVSTDRPVLLDMTQYNAVESRSIKTATAGLVMLCLIAVLVGFFLVLGDPDFKAIPLSLWPISLAIYAIFSVKSYKRSERIYTDEINSASAAIASFVESKYGLQLVDPVVFDTRWHVVADGTSKSPKESFQISATPNGAFDTINRRSVEVSLTLSSDRRDVTASVLTPAHV